MGYHPSRPVAPSGVPHTTAASWDTTPDRPLAVAESTEAAAVAPRYRPARQTGGRLTRSAKTTVW